MCLLEHIVNSYTRKFYCCSFTVSGEYLALINVLKLFLLFSFNFSRYWPFLDRRKDTSSSDELTLKRFFSSLIWNQPKPAHFVAYFDPGSFSILHLICCPARLKKQVIQDLKQEGIAPRHGSSKKDMIPGHDKAFVFVSGGIYPFKEKEMEDFYLK